MPKGRIDIAAPTREYWKSEYKKYLDGCSAQPIDPMEPEQRQILTCEKLKPSQGTQKVLAPRVDAHAAQLLIDQALLALEKNGFVSDEIECLREWMTKSAPSGAKGQAPVPFIDKLAAHYLYPRMTGQELREERTYRSNTLPAWQRLHVTPDELRNAIMPLTPPALQTLESDKRHRLNTMQAKKLLRELQGIHQNTLRRFFK